MGDKDTRDHEPLLLGLCATAFGIGVFLAVGAPPNHDVAWLLYAARRVSGGADLYRDIIETNPPLIVYALRPVTFLASLTGASSMLLFRLGTLLLAGGMLAGSFGLLRKARAKSGRRGNDALLAVATCLLVVTPGFELGQRDHLVILLMLPLMAAAAHRSTGLSLPRRTAIAVGICGALGIALKPFAGIVWLAIEGYLLTRRRVSLLRPENLSIIGVGIAYLTAVAIFEPDFFGFGSAALVAYRAYYPAPLLMLARQPATLFAVGAIVASRLLRPADGDRHLRAVLEVATAAFLVSVFVQQKGWAYHWIPVWTTAGLLLGAIFVERAGSRRGALVAAVSLAILGASALSSRSLGVVRSEWAEFSYYGPRMREVFEEHASGEPVMALTVRLAPGFAVAVDDAAPVRWASRFNVLWPIPGIYDGRTGEGRDRFPYHTETERTSLEWFLIAAVTQDLLDSRPALVIVELQSPQGLPGFDVLEYLQSASAPFREEFGRYDLFMRLGDYLIFKRREGSPEDGAS